MTPNKIWGWGILIVLIIAGATWYAFTYSPNAAAPSPTPEATGLERDMQELDATNLNTIDTELELNLEDAAQF